MRRVLLMVLPLVLASCSGGGESADTTTTTTTTTTTDVGPDETTTDGAATEPEEPETDAPLALPVLDDVVAPEWVPSTRTEELLDDLVDRGEPTAQMSIDALALEVDGVPSATPTDLPPGDGVGDAVLVQMLRATRDELVGDQAAFVDAFLDGGTLVASLLDDGTVEYPPTTTTTTEPPPTTISGFRRPTRSPASEFEQYAADLTYARDLWDQHFPAHPLLIQVDLVFSDSASDRMTAEPVGEGGSHCRITTPKGYRDLQYADVEHQFIFAHELFHCFQFSWAGGSDAIAPWVVEGSAHWAAIDLFRTIPFPHDQWYGSTWFSAAQVPLHSRTYYAWPLYENARLSGLQPYDAIRMMFQSPSLYTGTMLATGGLDGLVFRMDWSSRTLRSQALTERWQLPWPVVDTAAGPHDNALQSAKGTGTYHVVGAGSYSQLQQDVVMGPDVGVVVVTPDGGPLTTWTANGTVTVGEGQTGRFCFDPSGCVCPGGPAPDTIPMDGPDMLFSYPASLNGVTSTVIATPWDPDSRCDDGPAGGSGSSDGKDGASNGDPHLVTLDGLPYDVMTLGEFVLTRDPEGDFEVQTRHEPWGPGAGTTAVAIRTGTSRVTVTMPDFAQTPAAVVRVDGVATTEGTFTVDGVEVDAGPAGVEARWPDGTTVTTSWFMGWFVLVHVPDERAAHLVGLLGAGDDDLANDLRFADGTPADTNDADQEESPFALSWAVDRSTTLFDYEPGESPATFRVPHPRPEPTPLEESAVAECESALGDDAVTHELASCAYDVTVTGETDFTDAYTQVVEERVARNDVPLVIPVDSTPTSTVPGSVAAGRAGEPTLVLTADAASGVVAVQEGSIVLARARRCPEGLGVDLQVVRADAPDDLVVTALCDPAGLGGVLAGGDDEWFDGEAYVWVPGAGEYEVSFTVVGYDPELDLQPVDVFVDPTPAVVTGDQAAVGDERTLSGIGDTVVYLTNPGQDFDATGFDLACAVEVYWTATFPDPRPFALDSCAHSTAIDQPTSNAVIPTVVFTRTDDPVTVRLTPR